MQLDELLADDVVARDERRQAVEPREDIADRRLARATARAAADDVVLDAVADEADGLAVLQRVDQTLARKPAVLAASFRRRNRAARIRGRIAVAGNMTTGGREDDDRDVMRVEARQPTAGADRELRV